MKQEKGFTIIELLVAMAILGLLIGIMIPGIAVVQRGARNTARRTGAQAVQGLIEDYYGTHRVYPGTVNVSGGDIVITTADVDASLSSVTVTAGCEKVGENEFRFHYSAKTNGYELGVCMERGEEYILTVD